MGDIYHILGKENNNDNCIHLYKVDSYWFAFERSAFYLFSICYVDAVFKVRDTQEDKAMLIVVLKNGVHGMNKPQFTFIENNDNEIVIGFRTNYKGFLYWKESLVSLFTRNIYSTPDITHISNLKIS